MRKWEQLIDRCVSVEKSLVIRVLCKLEVDKEKYFRVELSSDEEVLISESHLNRYFPNKLSEYYESLIESLTTSVLIPS